MDYQINNNINLTKFLKSKAGTTITAFVPDSTRNNHNIYNVLIGDSITVSLLDNIVAKQEFINQSLRNYETEIELFAIRNNILLNPVITQPNKIPAQNVVKGKIYKIAYDTDTINKDLGFIGATKNTVGNVFVCNTEYLDVNVEFQPQVFDAYVYTYDYFENSKYQFAVTNNYNKLTGYTLSGTFSNAMMNTILYNEDNFKIRLNIIEKYLEKIRSDLIGKNLVASGTYTRLSTALCQYMLNETKVWGALNNNAGNFNVSSTDYFQIINTVTFNVNNFFSDVDTSNNVITATTRKDIIVSDNNYDRTFNVNVISTNEKIVGNTPFTSNCLGSSYYLYKSNLTLGNVPTLSSDKINGLNGLAVKDLSLSKIKEISQLY